MELRFIRFREIPFTRFRPKSSFAKLEKAAQLVAL